jgi:hypothetical protein
VAINASGHAYAGFFSPTSSYDPPWQASLVLTRGTISDGSAATFGDLKETDNASPVDCTVPDGKLGFRMRPCVYVPDDQIPPVICPSPMGKQRRGENQVAIAIDPNDATKTYIAYADSQPGDFMTLHLVAATASASSVTDTELRMVHNALNPGVAVTRSGRIGFVYQAFVADAANPRWQTRIEISNETHAQWDTLLLSDTPSDEPAFNCGANEAPYLGDYLDIGVAGNTFYGVFSADNNPAHHESPSPPGDQESVVPAKYLRDKTLLGPILTVPCSAGTCNAGGGVNYSIDPFFFRVTLRVHPWTSFKEHANATFLRVVQFFRRIRQVPPPPPPPPPLRPPSK